MALEFPVSGISEYLLSKIAFCSREMSSVWVEPLNDAMKEFEINTPARATAFLAQVLHESNLLTELTENLHYSAKRLVQVWPRHFVMPPGSPAAPAPAAAPASPHAQQPAAAPESRSGLHDATQYSNKPEALANLIYANRLGNGPVGSEDGWRYRGRGLIQMTGRTNYRRATEALNIDYLGTPDLVSSPFHAAKTAAWYWSTINGNAIAEAGTQASFEKLTIAINGELLGLRERAEIWNRAKAAFSEL